MTDQTNGPGMPTPDGPANLIETDYQIGQDNINTKIGPFGLDIHNPVFAVSALTIIAFVLVTLAFQDSVGPIYGDIRVWLTETLDWFFIGAANIFVLLCLYLIISPLGVIRVRVGLWKTGSLHPMARA